MDTTFLHVSERQPTVVYRFELSSSQTDATMHDARSWNATRSFEEWTSQEFRMQIMKVSCQMMEAFFVPHFVAGPPVNFR